MVCPRVHGDNPRASASGLSHVHVDKHGFTIYTTYISLDLHSVKYFVLKMVMVVKRTIAHVSRQGLKYLLINNNNKKRHHFAPK